MNMKDLNMKIRSFRGEKANKRSISPAVLGRLKRDLLPQQTLKKSMEETSSHDERYHNFRYGRFNPNLNNHDCKCSSKSRKSSSNQTDGPSDSV